MQRRSALKAKSKYKPVELERYHQWIAKENDCLVCGGEPEVHHVTGYADRPGRFRDDWLVAPLCPGHHRIGISNMSVEALGHQGFFQQYGIDLLAEAMSLAEIWQRKP